MTNKQYFEAEAKDKAKSYMNANGEGILRDENGYIVKPNPMANIMLGFTIGIFVSLLIK